MLNLVWHIFLITYYLSEYTVKSCCPKNIHLEVRKEKKKRRIEALKESQKGSIHKFFKSNTSTARNSDEWAIVAVEDQTTQQEDHSRIEDNVGIDTDDNNVSDHEPIFNSPTTESTRVDEEPVFKLICMIQ